MAKTTSTTITEIIPKIIAAAKFTLQRGEVIRPLVDNYDISKEPGLVQDLPIFAVAGVAGDATEGTDYSTVTTIDSGSGTSLAALMIKHIFQITDLATLGARENMPTKIGKMLGQAMAAKIDYDLAALFSGFSQTVAGAATALTAAHFEEAMQYLRQAFAPMPYNFVGGVKQIWGQKGISKLFTTGANYQSFAGNVPGSVAEDITRNGFAGTVLGFTVYSNPGIVEDGDNDVPGGFFSREAIAYVKKTDLRVEQERDASLTATEWVGSVAKIQGEQRDTYGVYALSDVV